MEQWRIQWTISWWSAVVVGVEEALLFKKRTEEGVERYTRMIDERWRERMMRLIELGGRERAWHRKEK